LSLEEYIRQSILYPDEFIVAGYPRGIHPTYYASTIDESDVEVLIQYILSMTPEG
jgi:hypothetical protein